MSIKIRQAEDLFSVPPGRRHLRWPVRRQDWLAFLAAVLAAALCAWSRWQTFNQSPYPPGVDGYYYAAQLRHHSERGAFFGADRSLALPLLRLSAIGANDPVRAGQRLATLLSAVLVLAAFAAARAFLEKSFGSRPENAWLAAFSAAAAAACSANLFLSLEYWKQLLGAVFFLLLLAALFSSQRRRLLWIGLFAVAAIWSHRSFVAYALLAVLPPALSGLWTTRHSPRWQRLWPYVAAFSVLLALALALFLWRESARIAQGFAAQWILAPIEYARVARGSVALQLEAWLVFAAAPLALLCCILLEYRQRIKVAWPLVVLIALSLVAQAPWFTHQDLGLGFRLYLAAHLFAMPLLAAALVALPRWAAGLLAIAAIVLIPLAAKEFQLPTRIRASVLEQVAGAIRAPADAIVIAHQPLDNVYYLRNGNDSYRYEPGGRFGSRPIWRVAHGLNVPANQRCLAGAEYSALPQRYFLFRENDWQRFRNCLSPRARENIDRNWRNVSRMKPAFLE